MNELTKEQAHRLLATCATTSPIDLRDRALLTVGLETGMRRMSLAEMTLDAETHALVPVKGSKGLLHSVPLSPAALVALKPWKGWLRTQKIAHGPVFRSLKRSIARGGKLTFTVGGGLSLVAIYKIVTRRAAAANLHVHPDIFRSTFIAWQTKAGSTPYQIAAILGLRSFKDIR